MVLFGKSAVQYSDIEPKSSTTVLFCSDLGPKKLNASPLLSSLFNRLCPNVRYPDKGSKTCCHGLVAFGHLILTVSFFDHALTVSTIILSFAQSPPPITFPALPTPNLM